MRNFILPVAAFAALIASPAAAEVIKQDSGGFVTRDSATVDATPREVWLALISPGKWWSAEHSWSGDAKNMTITPQAGGCFCERIPPVDTGDLIGLEGSVEHMVVIQSTPDKALRMRGGLGPLQSEPADGVLTIAMAEAKGGGTTITFEYVVGGYMRFEGPKISKAVDEVMSEQLGGLAEFLGGAKGGKPAPAKPDKPETEDDKASAKASGKRTTVGEAFGDSDKPE